MAQTEVPLRSKIQVADISILEIAGSVAYLKFVSTCLLLLLNHPLLYLKQAESKQAKFRSKHCLQGPLKGAKSAQLNTSAHRCWWGETEICIFIISGYAGKDPNVIYG